MKRHQLIALASVVLVACVDGGRSSAPSFAISDAAHGGGTRGFYFLPPMVPNPTPTGTFDRFRSPTVEICQLAGDENSSCTTTIATFTMTSGPGSVIRVVPADQHYIVNWHTNLTNLFPDLLPSPTIYRIQVFDPVSGDLLGFADVQLADNGKEAKSLTSNQMIGLVDGRTLPIKFRIEFGAVDLCPDTPDPCAKATVGPEGGQLVATDDDGVALAFADFPAGWTDTPRDVTISQIVSGCDGECGPGEGPLEGAPEGSRQYPLFFEYLTVPPATPGEPFNLPVRIGVCNVGEGFGEFHPPHRGTTALALGAVEDHGFVILDFAPTSDLLGGCVGVTPTPGDGERVGLNRLDGGWQGLLARAGVLAANVFAPRALNAAVLVDGGMGGSTEFFSPVGTVDTAPPEVEIDGTMSPGEWGESVASLLVNLPGEGTTSGDLFISNDATNLYFAVRFQRSVVDPGNSAAFEFDSNDNSSLDEGDDGIILNPSIGFRDLVRSSAPPCPATVGLCSFLDTQLGGTNDGAAAFRNDGTFTVYEFSHPLSSGDVLDFSRSAGQTLGLFLSIRLLVSGATFADTRFPAEGFYTITIGP